MIANRLKEETIIAHQSLEAMIVRKIKAATDKNDYAHLLSLFYGYYAPLESKIEQFIDTTYLPDIASRRKAGWLLNDIATIRETGDLPLAKHLPEITSAAQAIGALYVMEGSTLGGRHIAGMFHKILQTDGTEGFRFFNSYGADTGEYWKQFIARTNNFAEEHGHHDKIVQAANDTFLLFRQWIEEQGSKK